MAIDTGVRSGAQAVERAISVLDCFSTGEAQLGLSQLATRANLPTSTAYRIAQALVRGGLLERQGRDGYRVSAGMVALVRPVLSRLRVDAAAPMLYKLAARTKLTVSLGVAGERDFITVISARPPAGYCPDQLPAEHEPWHASALGKVMLAFGRSGTGGVLRCRDGLERYTERTITSPDDLLAEVAEIRRRGFATVDGERQPGVRAVAVPVFGSSRDLAVAAMGVQSVAEQLTDQAVTDLVPALQYFAREIGAELGSDEVPVPC